MLNIKFVAGYKTGNGGDGGEDQQPRRKGSLRNANRGENGGSRGDGGEDLQRRKTAEMVAKTGSGEDVLTLSNCFFKVLFKDEV